MILEISGIESIHPYEFARKKDITKVIFKDDKIKYISSYAFRDCVDLEEIYIPDSVVSIESSTFYGCEKLKKVRLSNSLSVLSQNIFERCTRLEEIEIPSSVKTINNLAFFKCKSLKNIKFNEGLTKITRAVFKECESLAEINIPNSLRIIEDDAFAYCPKLVKFNVSMNSELQILHLNVFGREEEDDWLDAWLFSSDIKDITFKKNSPFMKLLYTCDVNTSIDFLKEITLNPDSILNIAEKYSINKNNILFLLDKEEYKGYINGTDYGI